MAKKATNRDPATDRPGDPAGATITGAATAAADPPGIDADDLDDVYDDDEPRERFTVDRTPFRRLLVESHPALTDQLRGEIAAHMTAVADALEARGRSERMANVDERLATMPLPDLRKLRDKITGCAIEGLQAELPLAERRKELLRRVVDELSAARDAARAAVESTEKETRAGLAKIGYRAGDFPVAASHLAPAERQLAGIVAQSPDVVNAKRHYRETAAAFQDATTALANADAVRAEIAAELRQAVAAFLKSA